MKELNRAREARKPYGIGGVTLRDEDIQKHRQMLAGAKFIFLFNVLQRSGKLHQNHTRVLQTTEDIFKYAAEQGMSEEEALKKGMEEKSKEFVEKNAGIYANREVGL